MTHGVEDRHRVVVLERYVLFPLVLGYFGLMILAAWPRVLSPDQRPTRPQWYSYVALQMMGIHAGQEVFSGQGEIEAFPRRMCVQILGLNELGELFLVFDNFVECDDDTYSFSKQPLDLLYRRQFIKALQYAQQPQAARRGGYHLNYLLGVTDYYCHGHHLAPLLAVAARYRVQETRVSDGALLDQTFFGGGRACNSAAWSLEPLPGFEQWAAQP